MSKTLGVHQRLACGPVRSSLSGALRLPPTDAMVATMPLAVTGGRRARSSYSSVDYVWLRADIADPLGGYTRPPRRQAPSSFAQTKDADVGAVVSCCCQALIGPGACPLARRSRFDAVVIIQHCPGPREGRGPSRPLAASDQWFPPGRSPTARHAQRRLELLRPSSSATY